MAKCDIVFLSTKTFILFLSISLSIVTIITSMADIEGSGVNGNTPVSEAGIVGSNPASLVCKLK